MSPSTVQAVEITNQDNVIGIPENVDSYMDFFAAESEKDLQTMYSTESLFMKPALLLEDTTDMSSTIDLTPYLLPNTVEQLSSFDNLEMVTEDLQCPDITCSVVDTPLSSESEISEVLQRQFEDCCPIFSIKEIPSKEVPNARAETETAKVAEPTTNQQRIKRSASKSAENKYWDMRRKNNIASQRCRRSKKLKNLEAAGTVEKLEAQNKELLLVAERLEKQRDALQNYLVKILASKK